MKADYRQWLQRQKYLVDTINTQTKILDAGQVSL
jgi:hypothetical protein